MSKGTLVARKVRDVMTDTAGFVLSENELKNEIEHLKRGLLRWFILVAIIFAWLWFPLTMFREWALGPNAIPVAVLVVSGGVSYYVWQRKGEQGYPIACWVLLVSAMLANATILWAHPNSKAMAFGTVLIVAANILLGARASFVVAVLAWVAGNAARHLALGTPWIDYAATVDMALLYGLNWSAIVLANGPLTTLMQWAVGGWAKATSALSETRERRAELYRTLKALEEATYRIERMNEELIAARREAEFARAMKARFAAMVSHELRGPLNLILGFSRMMALSPEQYGEPLPPAYRADIATIHRNSQHLLTLIEDVLDLSRAEVDRLPLVKDRIDLDESVIKATIAVIESLVERKGLYLKYESPDRLPWVLADPVRLRQVLLNLLTNAIRFTQQGGITVRTLLKSGYVQVSVQDTGSGIAPEELPLVFQEFTQLSIPKEFPGGGSGLGLSISKQLIELHGGEMWVESTPGRGTTFYFTVPLPGTSARLGTVVTTAEISHIKRHQDNCLIIHSDPSVVRVLARHLESYRLVGVPSAEDALPLIERLHPRAIITDLGLADEFYEELLRLPYSIPLVSCSLMRPATRTYGDNVLAYLVKPITPETIRGVLHKLGLQGTITALVVDDDLDAARMLESLLLATPSSCRVLKAYDGATALATMLRELPDVVFLDLLMPGIDGKETLQRMHAQEQIAHIPVVIVSAQDSADEKADLGTHLAIRCQRPVAVAQGAKCLRAIIDGLHPDYLAREEDLEPSATASLDRSA